MTKLARLLLSGLVLSSGGCSHMSSHGPTQHSTSPATSQHGAAKTGRLPDPLPADPRAAQKMITLALVKEIEPFLRGFNNPYQLAEIGYFPPDDDDMSKKHWVSIDVTLGWYYCTPSDGLRVNQFLTKHGYEPVNGLLNVYGASKGDFYAEYGPMSGGTNCEMTFRTPIIKSPLPGPGSRTEMDKYLGQYKDIHADPHFDAESKPPHPSSYYGTPRGK